jgi:Caspase domain
MTAMMRLAAKQVANCIITVVLTLGMLATPAAAQRVALVMGNSNYSIKPLQNPTNDAVAVAAAFKSLGFDHVELKTDLTRKQMVEALQTFEPRAAGADVAVVFFAGHGTAMEQIDTYLVPIDAKLAREADLEDEAVSLKSVLRRLDGTKGLRLIILDACRNPPFPLSGRKRSNTRGLNRIEPDDNTLVAYATKDGATADDGVGSHSPFTTALLNRMTSPGLDVSFVFRHVRDDVMAATGRVQQPHLYGTLGATPIYLSGSGPVLAAAIPAIKVAPQPPQPAAQAPAASVPPSPVPEVWPWESEAAKEAMVSAVQAELKRVGCYDGTADGKWGAQSTAALTKLRQKLGASVGDQPTDALLATLKAKPGRVCPLVCDPDEHIVGGQCVTKPVPKPETADKPEKPTVNRAAGAGSAGIAKSRPAALQYSFSIWATGSIPPGGRAYRSTPYGGLTCTGGNGGSSARSCSWD